MSSSIALTLVATPGDCSNALNTNSRIQFLESERSCQIGFHSAAAAAGGEVVVVVVVGL